VETQPTKESSQPIVEKKRKIKHTTTQPQPSFFLPTPFYIPLLLNSLQRRKGSILGTLGSVQLYLERKTYYWLSVKKKFLFINFLSFLGTLEEKRKREEKAKCFFFALHSSPHQLLTNKRTTNEGMGNQTGSAGWLKDHEVGVQVASGGPNCQLKVFLGNRKIKKEGKYASPAPTSTTAAGGGGGGGGDGSGSGGTQKGEQVSLWLFDKRAVPQQELRSLGPFCELLSRLGGMMSRGLKHANVLSLLSPLQETKEAVLLETEPIFSSLRNILKDYTNLASVPSELRQFELDPFEIKMAVQQLTKGLLFLHSSEQLCCINLKPETVFLTKKGNWKIASFEFALPLDPSNPFTELPFTLECSNPQLDGQALPLQPYLEYLAPEIVYLKRYSANSDSFSLGCLIFELYTGRRLLQQGDGGGMGGMSVATSTRVLSEVNGYKGAIERALYPSLDLSGLPLELHKPLQELLSVDPQRRLSIQGFLDSSYFNDIVMRSIVYLSSLPSKDPSEKATFFNGLGESNQTSKQSSLILSSRFSFFLFFSWSNTQDSHAHHSAPREYLSSHLKKKLLQISLPSLPLLSFSFSFCSFPSL
jgi:hypothetical protein